MPTGIDWPKLIRSIFSQETAFTVSVAILVMGVVIAYLVWRWTNRALQRAGVPGAVEGTPFERSARGLGTSTAGIVAQLAALFVYVAMVVIALQIAQLLQVQAFWTQITGYLPRLFIAALAVIVGLIGGDKAKLYVSERLRSIKLPEAELIPELLKYSVLYIAALVALAQIGVATTALLILLAAYSFGLIVVSAIALKDFLAAGAAGVFLLLNQPYTIGDRVRIGDREGIVQEIDMFVTHVEADDTEYVVPNQQVFRQGIVRVRD
jgi:small-conductance mechanosensitive channel